MKNWAIIPARSGSKGLKNKNIKFLGGIPLIAHAINFAKSFETFDKVFVSTDSKKYAEIATSHGAWVPFLRSKKASDDNSMEEDILIDIDFKLRDKNIDPPDMITWLRPTFPFRSKKDLKKGLELLTDEIDSVRLVTESDPRIFYMENTFLKPVLHSNDRSMIRRQEMMNTYNVYHTDIFWYKNISLGKKFLGSKSHPVVINKICSIDIDSINDFVIADILIRSNETTLKEYINLN